MEYPREIAHGIMFHHFHGGRHQQVQGSVSSEDLEVIVQFIGAQRILTPAQWLDKLGRDRLGPQDLCLTFDDGLLSQFEVALPLLDRYKLKAFWFVYSGVFEGHIQSGKLEVYRAFRCKFFATIEDFYTTFFHRVFDSGFGEKAVAMVTAPRIRQLRSEFPFYSVTDARFRLIRDLVLGRDEYEGIMDNIIQEHGVDVYELAKDLWMADAHLRYLTDQGHVVGLHSYSHPTALAALPYTEQREEYEKNYQHILGVCGRAPVAMAHPTNSYTKETIDILTDLGICCGFRSNMSPRREGDGLNPNKYEMAREDHANILGLMGGAAR